MNLPQRKLQRLKDFNYSENGYYFVTICTHNKRHIFGKINNSEPNLNEFGNIARMELLQIHDHFPTIHIDIYTIMPNHIHAILVIDNTLLEENKAERS